MLVVERGDAQMQSPICLRDFAHRLATIHKQIDEDLKQLNRITLHAWKSGRDVGLYIDARELGSAAAQGQCVANYRLNGDSLEVRLASLEKGAKMGDHARSLFVALRNVLEDFLHLCEIQSLVLEQTQPGL